MSDEKELLATLDQQVIDLIRELREEQTDFTPGALAQDLWGALLTRELVSEDGRRLFRTGYHQFNEHPRPLTDDFAIVTALLWKNMLWLEQALIEYRRRVLGTAFEPFAFVWLHAYGFEGNGVLGYTRDVELFFPGFADDMRKKGVRIVAGLHSHIIELFVSDPIGVRATLSL